MGGERFVQMLDRVHEGKAMLFSVNVNVASQSHPRTNSDKRESGGKRYYQIQNGVNGLIVKSLVKYL